MKNNNIIKANKDKNFKKMLNLSLNNKYNLDRFTDNNFIESVDELNIIGKEIIDNLNIDNINNFIDICSAPGIYANIILQKYSNSNGFGISLPIEDGGSKYIIDNKRFKPVYKNILDTDILDIINNVKYDFGIGSCVSYINDKHNTYLLNTKLIITSIQILLSSLKPDGSIIINLSLRNIDLVFNIINLLNKSFIKFKLWKSENIWVTKRSFYYYGYGFKNNYIHNKYEYIKLNMFNNTQINTQFIGSPKQYYKIYKQMKNIYNIRINSFIK